MKETYYTVERPEFMGDEEWNLVKEKLKEIEKEDRNILDAMMYLRLSDDFNSEDLNSSISGRAYTKLIFRLSTQGIRKLITEMWREGTIKEEKF